MSKKINIRPTTSVYKTYKNINYDLWTAIAEFVDNSTQSYFDNEKKLKESKYWDKCRIDINYEKDDDGEYYLEIVDNAFGMAMSDFERAIVLDSKPKHASRSEFGMGLKTAACWFGLNWSVESTALGNGITYRTEIDVESLSKYKTEMIDVEETPCSNKKHGTIIRIWNLNRKITGRSIGKTKNMLRGMYREDIRKGDIEIYYNNEKLIFEDPEVYEEIEDDGKITRWERDDIKFTISHEGKEYHVTGKIGIRKKASTTEAGLTLMRRGRVIIGGFENNYRPEEIFGKTNSFEYQRIFGEIHMDDWPVVQTKDNFDWKNGLEDLFIEKMAEFTDDYVKKSRKIRVRKVADIKEATDKMVKDFEEAGIIHSTSVESYEKPKEISNTVEDKALEVETNENENQFGSEEDNQAILKNNTGTKIKFTISNTEYTFNLVIENYDEFAQWLTIRNMQNNEYEIIWNIKHEFFKRFNDDPNFIVKMQSFIFAFAISEVSSMKTGENGLISPSTIRNKMNTILKDIGGK